MSARNDDAPCMRIKICGLTYADDIDLAIDLGATHIGCVVSPTSPRGVSAEQAVQLLEPVRDQAHPVLVFRDIAIDSVVDTARAGGIATVQLHGYTASELEVAARWGLRLHHVVPVHSRSDIAAMRFEVASRDTDIFHLDVGRGGTGRRFPWADLAPQAPLRTFVAGGITPENVDEVLDHHPWGIDISSGVEFEPGTKDKSKLERLFVRVRAHDHTRRHSGAAPTSPISSTSSEVTSS